MEIKEIMTKDVIFVDKDVDLKYVLKLMKKHGSRVQSSSEDLECLH